VNTNICVGRKNPWGALGVLTMVGAIAVGAAAEEIKFDFDGEDALARWEIQGDARLDDAQARAGKALRVGPGARVMLRLRDTDGSGEVKMWVYDDGTTPTDPEQSRATAHWGVINANGRILAVGPFCAKYLSGQNSYATGEYTPEKRENPVWKAQHLGVPRKPEWREWTFRFDPDKGLSILVDGQDVNASRARFDWGKSEVGGFVGIVIAGDKKGDDSQTIWVDDVTVTLGGAMNVQPAAAKPAE